jgi:hypothetical protein
MATSPTVSGMSAVRSPPAAADGDTLGATDADAEAAGADAAALGAAALAAGETGAPLDVVPAHAARAKAEPASNVVRVRRRVGDDMGPPIVQGMDPQGWVGRMPEHR